MKRDCFFLYLLIINSSICFVSFCFIVDIFELGISYQLEQILWSVLGSSLAILYLSYLLGFVLFQEKKREPIDESSLKKKKIRKIFNYWYPLFWISISIIIFDGIVYMYLKSLFPLDMFNNIVARIDNPLGMTLYIIFWIGTINLIISFLFFIYLYNNRSNRYTRI